MARADHNKLSDHLITHIDDLVRLLCGEPNRSMSSRQELRFGTNGSLSVMVAGDRAGVWYDHEAGLGGGALELVKHSRGLSSVEARQWACDWLGLTTSSSSTGAKPSRPAWADLEGAARVAAILAACLPPEGTVVDQYLNERGITARPLPDCIKFLPDAWDRFGAMVATATDDDGNVQALQLTYLNAAGRKAPIAVQKRSFKAREGWAEVAAVRIGAPSGALAVCEGTENALAVWQATGSTVWACLGVSNIAKAPFPTGAMVTVARDGDVSGSKADEQIGRAVEAMRGRGFKLAVATPPPGKDFNDLLLDQGEESIRQLIGGAKPQLSTEWKEGLLVTTAGKPLSVLANAIHALRRAPEWQGVLAYDEFGSSTVARKAPPWQSHAKVGTEAAWCEQDDCLATEWLQRAGMMASVETVAKAIETVAREHPFHPPREYLNGLAWDQRARLDNWLVTYLGVQPSDYVKAVSARWMISAVARIDQPGCKADCVLILEGPQGLRKSSALEVLGGPWFSDRMSELKSKDAAMETRGIWIMELAELDTLSRSETGTVKAFMSRTHDRFRPPYGKRLVNLPRQCVFAGTVNPVGGFLRDPTGARRFWPVACGAIDLDGLVRDRDQLWAEARERFKAGEAWWLDTVDLEALARDEQDDRYVGDVWEEPVQRYVNGRDSVSIGEILEHALLIPASQWKQVDQNRVARILASLHFEQYRARTGGHGPGAKRERRYRLVVSNNTQPGPRIDDDGTDFK